MGKVKLGIIGFGNMGSVHAKNILEGFTPEIELVAVADTNSDRRAAAEKLAGSGVKLFESGSDLIESGVCEAILIATPHYQRPTLNRSVSLPVDEDLFLSMLNERRAASQRKENVKAITFDTSGSYGF